MLKWVEHEKCFITSGPGHNLSIVHYYIQSITSKIDWLHLKLFHFDQKPFTEIWLSASVDADNLMLESYNQPERKASMAVSYYLLKKLYSTSAEMT